MPHSCQMSKLFLIMTLVYEYLQATFFMTYVLTSGWASLSVEIMQPLLLLFNILKKFIFLIKEDPPDGAYSFPYHTEVPRVLLFGLIGFVCSILAPLILPFLLIYFLLAYLVYRNQVCLSNQCFFVNIICLCVFKKSLQIVYRALIIFVPCAFTSEVTA